MHASYEDRPAAEDPVMAALGARPTSARSMPGRASSSSPARTRVDLLYLHHLTPLNEAAARVLPDTPVIGHIHGSELLMLERIARGTPAGWAAADDLGRAAVRLGGRLHPDRRQQPEGAAASQHPARHRP